MAFVYIFMLECYITQGLPEANTLSYWGHL
jgi:hypothetical protein